MEMALGLLAMETRAELKKNRKANTSVNVRLKRRFIGFFTVTYFFLMGCQSPSRNDSHAHIPIANIENGKILAGKYCQSCHELPDPSLLDAKTWEFGVLPAMGPHVGISSFHGNSYAYHGDVQMRGPGYASSGPKVTNEDWQNIMEYYTSTSPDLLPAQDRSKDISMKLPLFHFLEPELNYRNAQSCFVKVIQNTMTPLVVSDAISLKTYFLNAQLQPVDSLTTSGPVVNIFFNDNNSAVACNMDVLKPNDDTLGSLISMKQTSDKWKVHKTNLISGLRRPTQVLEADINNDGKMDDVICEFGYQRGSLSWRERQADGHFEKHTLSQLPGALKAELFDNNNDGMTDIMALFAQGIEGIFLYVNKGNGNFEEKELLRFPAVYGSSYFELADFNEDGLTDIIYTCGDNADYSTILKPYHGVYIYLNKGESIFEQSYFYPIHGCYKAMAKDFDKDGDLDLVTIAYYADFTTQPEEGFVYLENQGDLHFRPYSSPRLKAGRWITMDVGDIDNDGWPDVVLGNFVQPSKFANHANWSDAPPLVILKNKGL